MTPAPSFTTRHRGPYVFLVTRPSRGKSPWRTEWLAGKVDADDVVSEAQALLGDSRDSIVCVDVWSIYEEQFVHTVRRDS